MGIELDRIAIARAGARIGLQCNQLDEHLGFDLLDAPTLATIAVVITRLPIAAADACRITATGT